MKICLNEFEMGSSIIKIMVNPINKFLTLLLLIIFGKCNLSFSQKVSFQNSVLWKVTDPSKKHISYLYGTIHLICKSDFRWSKKMNDCFESCDEVVFETDISNHTILTKIKESMQCEHNKKLRSYFTAEQYQKINKYF